MEEYILKFEYVSSQVGRLPEEQYLGYFMGGLKSEIRLRVRTFNPRTRVEAMKIARDVETELRGSLVRRSGGTRQWKGERESHYGPGGVGENGSGSNPSGGSGLGL